MNRKIFLIIIIVLGLLIGAVFYFRNFLANQKAAKLDVTPAKSVCLKDNEYADYTIDEKYAKEIKVPKNPLVISVRDKQTLKEKFSFRIENINTDIAHSLELYKCGVYVMRFFNYDPKKTKQDSGFKVELWKYSYDGKGQSILLFSKKDAAGNFKGDFSYIFSIDPQEKYIVLERGYLGSPDYAGVIKELGTLKDAFVLTLEDIKKINPAVEPGIIGLGKWSNDGKLVWGTVFNGPVDTGYIRVEVGAWKTDVFLPPPGLSGEQALNTNGYIAYTDFTTFYGIDSIAQDAFAEFRKEGRQKHLYLYNFFTKEKKLLASVSDPEWHFKLKWISDTELGYTLPTGEKKIYKTQ